MGQNNAKMIDVKTLIQAGFNPKTGLPAKLGNTDGGINVSLKESIKHLLTLKDKTEAINRYTWYNLPSGLNGQLLERILYYKGQGAFFYIDETESFYFLPYALNGTIDVYGRYTGITPLPFNGSTTLTDEDKKTATYQWLQLQLRKPQYEVVLPEELDLDTFKNSCVLLKDYSEEIGQEIIPRSMLNMDLIDATSDCIPFMRTSLLAATGVAGLRVGSQDEQANVTEAAKSMYEAALTGKKWIAIAGQLDFQDLATGGVAKAEEYMLAMQALDNFRLGTYGIDNNGLFQKKAHMLQSEQNMNAGGGATGLAMQDGLELRQRFCNIVNSIWGLGIWCDVSETVSGMDTNGDGQVQSDYDQSGSANNTPEGGTTDDRSNE